MAKLFPSSPQFVHSRHPKLVCVHLISSSQCVAAKKLRKAQAGRKTQVHSISLLYRKKSRSWENSLPIPNELLIQRFPSTPVLPRHWWFNEFQRFFLSSLHNLEWRNNCFSDGFCRLCNYRSSHCNDPWDDFVRNCFPVWSLSNLLKSMDSHLIVYLI